MVLSVRVLFFCFSRLLLLGLFKRGEYLLVGLCSALFRPPVVLVLVVVILGCNSLSFLMNGRTLVFFFKKNQFIICMLLNSDTV
jgi:hypothetical protein